ncbi:phage minor capsid protein [Nocardia rhizosphaerae]|uniref:Phage minor capsid protein n=1 Tax=Nocardia rhizosphaerae TaxID=1691571 RepID=A0ABV8LDH5_9NOCA
MPLTPSNGDRGAGPLVRLYRLVELALWRTIARLLGLDGFGRRWLLRILAALPRFRASIRRIAADAGDRAPALVEEAIERAWVDGSTAARDDIGSGQPHRDDRRTRAIIDRVLEALDDVNKGLPRGAEQIVRRTADETARDQRVDNTATHRRALERITRREARRGFTGLVDSRGRRRELVAYVEAQIRGAISETEIDGYMQHLVAHGYDLFIVSDVPGSCELCRPFEGKIISITGSTAGAIARDTSSGRTVRVEVMCSLDEARARGLFHPNCRHTIRVWTPDNPAPPRAVRVSETRRIERRAAAAQQRADRVRRRVAAASKLSVVAPRMATRSNGDSAGGGGSRGRSSIPPSPFDSATTPADVAQILHQLHGIRAEGFDHPDVTLDVAQEFARAIHDMMTRYPSRQLQLIRIGEPRNPGRLDTTKIVGETPARPPGPRRDNYEVVDITLNLWTVQHMAEHEAGMVSDAADGYHPAGFEQRPIYSAMVHEYGHVLDFEGNAAARENLDLAMQAEWMRLHPRQPGQRPTDWIAKYRTWRDQLPGYSFFRDSYGDEVQPEEALAEAFAEVELLGDNASEPAKFLHRRLLEAWRGDA